MQELHEREMRAKLYEKFNYEDPKVLSLCGALFPEDHNSVWNGPHSLFKQVGAVTDRSASGRSSSIHDAIKSFFKS